jgi:hypothetical protein
MRIMFAVVRLCFREGATGAAFPAGAEACRPRRGLNPNEETRLPARGTPPRKTLFCRSQPPQTLYLVCTWENRNPSAWIRLRSSTTQGRGLLTPPITEASTDHRCQRLPLRRRRFPMHPLISDAIAYRSATAHRPAPTLRQRPSPAYSSFRAYTPGPAGPAKPATAATQHRHATTQH